MVNLPFQQMPRDRVFRQTVVTACSPLVVNHRQPGVTHALKNPSGHPLLPMPAGHPPFKLNVGRTGVLVCFQVIAHDPHRIGVFLQPLRVTVPEP